MTDVIAGRFALCDPIARGGSGVVWRAYDRKLGRFCAAKVLRRRDAGDLLRFVREQSFRLSHHHVLTPYSWAAEDAHVVIASELVDGGSLSTLIGGYGPIAEPTVAVILDQVLEALEQVHAAGLVHRDVKPANLLLRATGQGSPHVMLGDFGLAMGAHDAHLTEIGMVVGTPGYLAPEVLRGGVAPDIRQDLFAAGRVAVALLNGVEPRDHAPVQPATPPSPLRDLVVALTALDVNDRPVSPAQARLALGPLVAGAQDRPPVTRAGEPVQVRHQLPPLSEQAQAEARATEPVTPDPGSGRHAASGSGPGSLPTGPLGADSGATPPSSTAPTAPTAAATQGLPAATRGGRPRRRALIAAAAVVVAAGIAVPIAVAATGSPSPTTPSSTTPAGEPIEVGTVCTWQQQGDSETASDNSRVVCTTKDGTYVWTSTG